MTDQVKQMIVKSIVNRNVTESELEKLEQMSLHDLLHIIIQVGPKIGEGGVVDTVRYLYLISEHYKTSGGSIHHEKGTVDL